MPTELSRILEQTISRELPCLRSLTDEIVSRRPDRSGAWSRKEELGHLIDSAANNHNRFVRASSEGEFRGPGYEQDSWVALHGYQYLEWSALVDFWYSYNRLLAHLVQRIPEQSLTAPCFIGSAPPITLGFVIDDYVLHMQHHLDHILSRERITTYPRGVAAV